MIFVKRYQHHAAAWGVFAAWIQMLLYMERTPRFGVFIHLLRKVSKTILNLFLSYSSLLVAFTLTFYLLFPSHYAFNNDLPSVFVKVNINFYMHGICIDIIFAIDVNNIVIFLLIFKTNANDKHTDSYFYILPTLSLCGVGNLDIGMVGQVAYIHSRSRLLCVGGYLTRASLSG